MKFESNLCYSFWLWWCVSEGGFYIPAHNIKPPPPATQKPAGSATATLQYYWWAWVETNPGKHIHQPREQTTLPLQHSRYFLWEKSGDTDGGSTGTHDNNKNQKKQITGRSAFWEESIKSIASWQQINNKENPRVNATKIWKRRREKEKKARKGRLQY